MTEDTKNATAESAETTATTAGAEATASSEAAATAESKATGGAETAATAVLSESSKDECECTKKCEGCPSAGHDDDDVPPMTRSDFTRTLFALVALTWGGLTSFPIFMYLNPPASDQEEHSKVTSIEVCKVADLPPGTGKNFRFGSFPAILICTEDKQLHAFKAICTHLGCTVQFRADKQNVYCACHGGEYDAATGKNIAGPPPKPLTALKAEVKDGKIIVSLA